VATDRDTRCPRQVSRYPVALGAGRGNYTGNPDTHSDRGRALAGRDRGRGERVAPGLARRSRVAEAEADRPFGAMASLPAGQRSSTVGTKERVTGPQNPTKRCHTDTPQTSPPVPSCKQVSNLPAIVPAADGSGIGCGRAPPGRLDPTTAGAFTGGSQRPLCGIVSATVGEQIGGLARAVLSALKTPRIPGVYDSWAWPYRRQQPHRASRSGIRQDFFRADRRFFLTPDIGFGHIPWGANHTAGVVDPGQCPHPTSTARERLGGHSPTAIVENLPRAPGTVSCAWSTSFRSDTDTEVIATRVGGGGGRAARTDGSRMRSRPSLPACRG
jgi:hypothetical protein